MHRGTGRAGIARGMTSPTCFRCCRAHTLFAIRGRAKPVFPLACYTCYTGAVVAWLMLDVPGFSALKELTALSSVVGMIGTLLIRLLWAAGRARRLQLNCCSAAGWGTSSLHSAQRSGNRSSNRLN